MKKIIRVLFFVFALVLFTGTAYAAKQPTYKLTVNFVDERTGEKTFKEFASNKKSTRTDMSSFLNLSSGTTTILKKSEDGKEYSYIFQNWTTSEGTQVGIGETEALTIDGIRVYVYSKSLVTSFIFDVPALTEDKEITLHANWSDKIYQPEVKIHVYDNKAYSNNSAYDKTNLSRLGLNTTSGTRLDLNQMFLNSEETSYLRYDDKTEIVKLNKNASYYKFVKYVDAEGNEIVDGYTSNVIKSVKLHKEYKVGNNKYTNSLEITFNNAKDAKATEDIDLNIYVVWDEFTTAILEHKYIDEVSTGSGSGSNPTGGAVSYTHTFSNPEDKTPKTHYDFLYWQHEESDDDQVDSTKEYKDGDSFTYNLSNKPSGWKGKVTTYAWWQPDVTLNLYSDGKLLSSESSFTSVSTTTPTKYGYNFLGWYDANDNKVTETTFYAAEKGINPEVREYTLYAKWERIMVEVKVSKVWSDNNDEDEIRTESVTVELKDGEETIEVIELSEKNNWTYTFVVPKYNEESEINYTVSEEEIENYTTEITGSIEEGFVITNTHEVWPKGDGEETEETNKELVQTGSEINYSIMTSVFMVISLVGFSLVSKKRFN